VFPFASDERFPSAEALEDLFPNPPQSQKRRFTRWLTGCRLLTRQSISKRHSRAHPGWRTIPFFQSQMVLLEELMGFQSLADKRNPVDQAYRLLHVASYDPHR
jgi:hypothetical protein